MPSSHHFQDFQRTKAKNTVFARLFPAVSAVFPCTYVRSVGKGVFQVQRLWSSCGMLSPGMLAIVLASVAGLAQEPGLDPGGQPCSGVTGQTTGCQLIAWSQIQQPQPLRPAPSPSPDQQAEKLPSGQPLPQPANPESGGQPPLIGVVVQDGGIYVLKTEDTTTCQLDDQGRARQYLGKKIRILGALDENRRIIHIESVDFF